jgi:DNA-binding MarR family transcriptional regulator
MVIQQIKDRTECFDDHFPCRKERCDRQHIWNWLKLFVLYFHTSMDKMQLTTFLVMNGGQVNRAEYVLDLHITNHKCLDLIHRFGTMPADRLAELTGLATGAATGIIDRLEKAGYVRRANDLNDRRRTIVEPTRNKKLDRKLEIIKPHYDKEKYKEMTLEAAEIAVGFFSFNRTASAISRGIMEEGSGGGMKN